MPQVKAKVLVYPEQQYTLSSSKGSTHVEVFSAQGRDPVSRWQLSGPVRREYSKQLKGYTYVMEGDSSTTRMRLPKSDKGTCESDRT